MAASPCPPISNITTGIFETGTPTVLTSMAIWRSRGSKMKPSTSVSSSISEKSPDMSSSAMSTCADSFYQDCKSFAAETFSNSNMLIPRTLSSLQCRKCTTWRCRPLEVSQKKIINFKEG